MPTNLIRLNGLRITLSQPYLHAFSREMASGDDLDELRTSLGEQWFLYWRRGVAYGVTRVKRPACTFGSAVNLKCAEHPQLLAALVLDQLRRWLEQRAYRALRRRPFTYTLAQGELVHAICGKLPRLPRLLAGFSIQRRYVLNTKLLEPREGETSIALVMGLGTRWEITADLGDLERAGIELRGMVVVRRAPAAGERRAVGRIAHIDGPRVILGEAYEGLTEVPTAEVCLEGSRATFAQCLRVLLASDYDTFEAQRRLEEAAFLGAAAYDDYVERMAAFLRNKVAHLDLGGGVRAMFGERAEIANTPEYASVTIARPFEYCFDRARTRRSQFAWKGIEAHGPFAPLARRSPRIAVIFPSTVQGPVENFVESLRRGITNLTNSHFAKGFTRTFDLVNPQFPLAPFRWLGQRDVPVGERYRCAVVDTLAMSAESPDAAIVVIPDEYARARDVENPYLHAKAALLMAGVPAQCVRASTLRQSPGSLQYTLQNFAVALCAKLGGVPWTVEQDLTVSDEIVIGLGSCELRDGRFGARERFVGITTVFRGDGNYILSHLSEACTYAEYPSRLRASATTVLEDIKRRNGWQRGDKVRVIVHSFKPLRELEAAAIMSDCVRAVGREQHVRFAFATVSHDHEFALFDPAQPGLQDRRGVRGRLVPERGVIVEIGRNTRLLAATGPSLLKRTDAPLPRPILVSLHDASDFDDRHYLAEQVLRFTSLSWRSVLPAREPVTIAYSEMIARQLTRLGEVPWWNPASLNEKLGTSRWFL